MGQVARLSQKKDNITSDSSKAQALRKKTASPKKTPLLRIITLMVVGYLFFAFGSQFLKLNQMDQEVANIKEQINSLEGKNRETKNEIRQLKSDTYVERIAREKLGLVKPGETVIFPVKPAQNNNSMPE
ncbi:MAG: FtsB family cell division protein [Thermincolia bacterium]